MTKGPTGSGFEKKNPVGVGCGKKVSMHSNCHKQFTKDVLTIVT